MLQLAPIRSAVRNGLFDATKVEVIRGDGGGTQPPYPFISYKMIMLGQKVGRANQLMTADGRLHEQQVELTMSVTCYSDKITNAETLAYQALQYFEIDGVESLQDKNIVIVQTSELTDRTTFLTTGYEYRIGFDVRIRAKASVLKDVAVIETVNVTNEGGL